ncbi:HAUS augmin-like complex subunit 1 isoform X2 [Passer montanus]|uniref:HAUS augmin-like complex subunit 1 isoform X2 n=1 Tax=Passer montanus TaxID=9160 RepID=UPI001961FF6F|nr:HAUS augmin-like complex subunit 1 isoform X2 [Passer montanus]
MALAGTSGGDSFQEKLTRVTSWLRKLFNDAPIPQYEVNERTVDILHEIVECNEESDKDAMLVIEDMKDRTSKYEAEAEYWHDILRETLGFFENSLFGEVTSDLVRSAMGLEVENTSLTRDIEKLEASQKAEQAKAEIHSKNLKFLEDKSKDMKIRIRDAENELVARGLDKSLTHEALMKSSEELAALHKKMEPLKMELASYLDLPPSILLAQVKVEEAKRELKVLDEELSREIEAVPFELL